MSPLKDFNAEILEMLTGLHVSMPWEQLLPVLCACAAGSTVVIQMLLQITHGRREDAAARSGTLRKENAENGGYQM